MLVVFAEWFFAAIIVHVRLQLELIFQHSHLIMTAQHNSNMTQYDSTMPPRLTTKIESIITQTCLQVYVLVRLTITQDFYNFALSFSLLPNFKSSKSLHSLLQVLVVDFIFIYLLLLQFFFFFLLLRLLIRFL